MNGSAHAFETHAEKVAYVKGVKDGRDGLAPLIADGYALMKIALDVRLFLDILAPYLERYDDGTVGHEQLLERLSDIDDSARLAHYEFDKRSRRANMDWWNR